MRVDRSHPVRRVLALAALIGGLMVVPAVQASAHATLVETTPGDSALVQDSPATVELHYDQPVGVSTGAVKVLAPDGTRVDTAEMSQTDGGSTVVEKLKADLPAGTYTILWRVLSADTHTVFGASTFSVKTVSGTSAAAAAEAAQASAGKAASDLLGVSRFVFYVGLLLLIGALGFLLLLWPAGVQRAAARRLLWIGWGAATLGTIGGLLMQGPYSEGLSLYWTFDPELIAEVLPTRFGISSLARLILLALAAGVLLTLRRLPRPVLLTGAGLTCLGLLLTVSSIGHAGTGDLVGFAFPSDVLHLAAAGAWMGGLALLATVLLRRPPVELAMVLPRWSRYAELSVLVLVITGTFAGWRQVREWGALTGTTYGVLLLVKVGLVAVTLAFGALGRARVRQHFAVPSSVPVADEPDDLPGRGGGGGVAVKVDRRVTSPAQVAPPAAARQLRRGVLVEAAIGLVVLGVTSVLVSTPPATETYFPVVTESAAVTPNLHADVRVTPARTGLDDLHVSYTDAAGKPVDLISVTGRFSLPGRDNVVPVTLTRSSPGHYDANRVELSAIGTWRLTINSQTSDIDSTATVFPVRVR